MIDAVSDLHKASSLQENAERNTSIIKNVLHRQLETIWKKKRHMPWLLLETSNITSTYTFTTMYILQRKLTIGTVFHTIAN